MFLIFPVFLLMFAASISLLCYEEAEPDGASYWHPGGGEAVLPVSCKEPLLCLGGKEA